jgi:aspartate/methionine/tyrosine aminotransferase
MNELNFQAKYINEIIKKSNGCVFELLSDKGKIIFFPKKGILGQTADAKNTKINATIGIALEEDNTPMRLKSISDNIYLLPQNIFPYVSSFGKQELRDKWKELLIQKNPLLKKKNISNPIVTNALTHGLNMVGYLFVNPNDKIICSEPYWGNYNLIFQNGFGGIIDSFYTFENNKFNIKGLKDKLFSGTGKKILLLNFPNNPTGYTITETESEELKKTIKEYVTLDKNNKVLVIIDDAYFGLVYEQGILKESIFEKLVDIDDNVLCIKIDGATKEDYVWGLRVGFITFNIKNGETELYNALENKTAGAIRGSISNASHLSQSLLYKAFNDDNYIEEKRQKYDLLKNRYLAVKKQLDEHPEYKKEFSYLPFNSGYFMCLKLNKDAEEVRKILIEKYDTGVIALGNLIRVAFSAVKTNEIPKLFENIFNACKNIS